MAKAGLLFVGTDDGALLYSNPNNIGRWLRIGQPFRGHAVRALWPLPENPLVVFAAVEGMGVQRSDDGGQSWVAALDVEASAIVGARSAPEILYLAAPAGLVYRSDDAGGTWVKGGQSSGQTADDARLTIAHHDPQIVYQGLPDGSVYVTSDGGATWATLGEPLPAPITALVESHLVPGDVYAAAGGVLYQGSSQSPWRQVAIPGAAASLAALAGKEPVLLLGQLGGGIARSDGAGTTWSAAEPTDDWAGDVGVIEPAGYHIDTAFAGTTGGRLFTTTDRGRSWQLLKQDLAPIRCIAAARLV